MNLFVAKHSTESFGAVSSAARSNVTAVFDQFGYSDNWISFGLSKCLSCSDFPCSHVCNRYTADYDVCECPPCWELGRDMTTCVPKTENYSLTCSSGMKVTLDSCVLGAASQNGDAVIMSQNGDCRAVYNSSGNRFLNINGFLKKKMNKIFEISDLSRTIRNGNWNGIMWKCTKYR